jgi:hypothetical protein
MKTLREYIDQLDEISRRDFIKGAGATAGLAAVGAPKDASAYTKEIYEKVASICYLYLACKGPYQRALKQGQTITVPPTVCQKTNQLIQKFIKVYPGGKDLLNSVYGNVYSLVQEDETREPFKGSVLNRVYFDKAFQQRLLNDFESLIEFLVGTGKAPTDQQLASVRQAMAMEEESLEETPEDPIAKIDALFKDKK